MLHLADFRPFPDEILYSIVSRYLRRNGIVGKRRNLEKLLSSSEDTKTIKHFELSNLLHRLNINDLQDQIDYLNETTLLPLEGLWKDNETIIKRAKDLMSRWVNPFDGFRYQFCPDCIADDIERYGVAYWHRIHQVDGVVICPEHRTILHKPVYNEEEKSYRYYFNTSLPTDFMGKPHSSVEVIEQVVFTESSWIVNRHADFSNLLLNIEYDLSKIDYWAVIKSALVDKIYGTPKAIEKGKFYQAWLPYLEGLDKMNSDQVWYAIYSQKFANRILFENSYYSCVIALLAFLFETPEKLLSKLNVADREVVQSNDIDPNERKEIIEWVDNGYTTDDIAKMLSVEPIDTWAKIRQEYLVPNEFIYWLTDSRTMAIEKLLIDYYEIGLIARELRIDNDELIKLIHLSPRLSDACNIARENCLMDKNKNRIKDMAISNWPCRFSQVKKILPDICEWVSIRDPSWVREFEQYINNRTRSHTTNFISTFKVKGHYEKRLEDKLIQPSVNATDATMMTTSNCS